MAIGLIYLLHALLLRGLDLQVHKPCPFSTSSGGPSPDLTADLLYQSTPTQQIPQSLKRISTKSTRSRRPQHPIRSLAQVSKTYLSYTNDHIEHGLDSATGDSILPCGNQFVQVDFANSESWSLAELKRKS